MLQLRGSAARAAKTWTLPGTWISLSVHLVLWYQTSSGKPLVHHNGGARSALRIWVVIFMVNNRPLAVEWHVHDKCLEGSTVVYSLNWLHCHVATGGIFGSLWGINCAKNTATALQGCNEKEGLRTTSNQWLIVALKCYQKTIVAKLKFLSEMKTQQFSAVHARPGVAYVPPTSQLQIS